MSASAVHDEQSLGKAYDARLLLRLWPFLRPYKRIFALDLLLFAPLFVLELAPAWIIMHGLDEVFGGGALGEPASSSIAVAEWTGPLSQWATQILDPPWIFSPLGWLVLLYAVVALASAGLQFFYMYLSALVGQLAMRDLRVEIFDHIQRLHLGFFDRYPVGRLVTRATSDIENLAEMFSAGLVALITDVLKMIGFAVVLFAISWKLSLAAFGVVPLLAVAAIVFRLKVRDAFRETRLRIARINTQVQETITGMKVVQLFTREQRNIDEFEEMNALNRNAWQSSNRWEGRLFSVVEIAQNLTVAVILGYGFKLAAVGTFYIFIDYMRRFFMPLRDLSAKYSVMQSSMASAERIFELLDTQPEVVDVRQGVDAVERATVRPGRRGAVAFEGVWFAYNDEEWVLEDVSFQLEPGEKVAFVGATGSGKTTLIKLLTRLYEPQKGRVLLDGEDLRCILQADVRRRVATVLQDVFLFSGSIAENIGLGREGLNDEDIERAARTVEAHRFIEMLPDGYQTELRERGADLSAGQRQLLSFARAVAHGSDVLVLDEATSSIDTETEMLVQRGIHNLMEGRTAIAIAHRLSTIQDVDRIYVLHKGRIVEFGSHEELLALEGVYYRLYRLQYRPEEAQAIAAG
ncbi:MAG: ABC transporter ATP-binding protein [Myxococcales bacterium]|nr:ABC transporter ATP-binding protein [Myxococcales bacterium]